MFTTPRLTRRALLASTVLAGTGLAAAACSNTTSTSDPGGASAAVRPTRVPFDGPKPDLPGDPAIELPDAFRSYPDPVSTGRTPLGLTAPVAVLGQGVSSGTPHDRNPWWQQWETDLGTDLGLTVVNSTQYTAKFQTAVAGDTLSDLTQVPTDVQQLPKLLEKMFTDLSPYLSGDNIKKYPNLANLPSATWDMCMVDGKLWGASSPRLPGGTVLMTRGDILESKGIDQIPDLSDGEAFLDLCREVTDVDKGVFAIGQVPENWTLPAIIEAMGGPNGWKVENGTWTSAFEAPEYEQALGIVAQMWKERLIHPNSYTDLGSTAVWFEAGSTVLFAQNISSWRTYNSVQTYPVGVIKMPKWDGGGVAAKHLGVPGYGAFMGLKKTDDEKRIDELLRVLDLAAAPFGTAEYLRVNYGVENRQWTMKDNQLVVDGEKSAAEQVPGMIYAGNALATTVYVPSKPEVTETIHGYLKEVLPDAVALPTVGKFSNTVITKGLAANKKLSALMSNIIQGRAKLSDWQSGVQAWKSEAGDAIAREYADQ